MCFIKHQDFTPWENSLRIFMFIMGHYLPHNNSFSEKQYLGFLSIPMLKFLGAVRIADYERVFCNIPNIFGAAAHTLSCHTPNLGATDPSCLWMQVHSCKCWKDGRLPRPCRAMSNNDLMVEKLRQKPILLFPHRQFDQWFINRPLACSCLLK